MLEGTGLIKAKQRFPDRTWDVGIAEQHAVTFAAGLACEGIRPVVAIYSTFLQRAYDQIIHDVALQRLPVTFALDRGGLVGADGKTHQGAFDLAYLRCVPNLVVMAPSDENELRHMLHTSLALDGPAAFRFPRGAGAGVPLDPVPQALEVGKGRIVRPVPGKPDVCVVAVGSSVRPAIAAAEALAPAGIAISVVDARFVKPIDEDLVVAEALRARRLLTVEEGCLPGGFGSAVLELLERRGLVADGVLVRRLGLPDQFVTHGDQAKQRAELGIDEDGIARACRELAGMRATRGAA
jgi:1-deoxy-D-xylulose-5-phosphate synthase